MSLENDQNVISGYITDCKKRGIEILPPDINTSTNEFQVKPEGITYRITAITHVGENAIKGIVKLRPIENLVDLINRRDKMEVKANVLKSLVKAGCFDFENPNRADLIWQIDMLKRNKTQEKNGFEFPRYEWNDKTKSEWEKEALGTYLSIHPMERYGFKPLSSYKDKEKVLQGGEVYEVSELYDKKGKLMAFVSINTLFGNLKLICFWNTWAKDEIKNALIKDNIVMVRGSKSGNDVIVDTVEIL